MRSLRDEEPLLRPQGEEAAHRFERGDVVPSFDTFLLPVDARTARAIMPSAQPGYYPGYDVLSQRAFWDEPTRNVIMQRVEEPPPIRFFKEIGRVELAYAVFDRILPQDDRDPDHRIPIVNFVDKKLYERQIPGYRYEDMPDDQETYKLGFEGIEAIAHHLYGRSFVELEPLGQDRVLISLHDANPLAGGDIWKKLSIRHFWMLLVEHAAEAYYAHPYAWNEIGYGGPAYPRGYMRLDNGKPEGWEVEEQRYEWVPPPASLSGELSPIGGKMPLDEQLHGNVPSPTGGGTH
jgi:Gluconate 2-dehydrogenase subunit 3